MSTRKIYCSGCDREVEVANLPAVPDDGAGREVPEVAEAVCLDHGRTCTGTMCPLFDVAPDRMRARLHAHQVRAY